jgi:hypothetical protein
LNFLKKYKESIKPKGTEEIIDSFFYRPLGYLFAYFFMILKITPNFVSCLAGILGVASGVLIAKDYLGLGIFMINLALILDCSDGQLARLTQNYSLFGRALDGIMDYLCFTSLFLGLIFYFIPLYPSTPPSIFWLIGVLAGISLSIQAASLDFYRNLYFQNLKGDSQNQFEKQELQKLQKKKMFFLKKWVVDLYTVYMMQQEKTEYPPFISLKSVSLRRYYGTSTHIFLISICALFHSITIYLIISLIFFNLYLFILKLKKIH